MMILLEFCFSLHAGNRSNLTPITTALQLIKPNKSWKCAVVLMEPLFKFTDNVGWSTHITMVLYNFWSSILIYLCCLLVCWSQIQVFICVFTRNLEIDTYNTVKTGVDDFSLGNFFSLSISHFCLLLSSVHCFS